MRLWEIYHPEIPDFLAEAAETAAMQRLQDVGMNCGCEYTSFPLFADIERYSRLDHSVGVGMIVWHFTGDRAQAMSGLLHDIATPVFAHVVDFLHGDHMTQESTEQGTAEVIQSSGELCSVLQRYGLTVDSVADYHRYPVADNDSPKLSADRLEYTLGNAVNFGIIAREQAAEYYGDLSVGINELGETELAFSHPEIARTFAEAALCCSKIYVSDEDRYAMQALAELLRQAMETGVLHVADLDSQESAVIAKLKESPLSEQWRHFRGYREILRREKAGDEGQWLRIFAKKRSIDPYVKNLGRASELFPVLARKLQDFREYDFGYWLCAR